MCQLKRSGVERDELGGCSVLGRGRRGVRAADPLRLPGEGQGRVQGEVCREGPHRIRPQPGQSLRVRQPRGCIWLGPCSLECVRPGSQAVSQCNARKPGCKFTPQEPLSSCHKHAACAGPAYMRSWTTAWSGQTSLVRWLLFRKRCRPLMLQMRLAMTAPCVSHIGRSSKQTIYTDG